MGKNTLCILTFQCWNSIYEVKSFILSKKKLINKHQLYKSWKFSLKMQHVLDTSNFSLNMLSKYWVFLQGFAYLQFDILNME